MKLTWFADTTIRIHIGGAMLVADPKLAPAAVDRAELVSGADRTFRLATDDPQIPAADPEAWRPRNLPRVIDEGGNAPILLYRIGAGSVLVDAAGEPPLVLLTRGAPPRFGRWSADAVLVLFHAGEELVATATVLLDVAPPRLIALAADEADVDLAIAELGEHLDGTALVSLEPGLALEI